MRVLVTKTLRVKKVFETSLQVSIRIFLLYVLL
nr:MAG TPA: hypothetical protein [Caudoviricetes sp.]